MRMAFYFDQSRCLACNSCTVACKDYYGINPGPVQYRRQKTYDVDDGIGNFYSITMSCNHCETPACVSACAAGAITKRNDGIVTVDRTKCRELKSCITACPFAKPMTADDRQETKISDSWQVKHPVQKCHMCVDLLDKGEKTVCERACPVYAIEVGEYDELMRKHPGAEAFTRDKYPYAFENATETGPSLIIKPRKNLKISGTYK